MQSFSIDWFCAGPSPLPLPPCASWSRALVKSISGDRLHSFVMGWVHQSPFQFKCWSPKPQYLRMEMYFRDNLLRGGYTFMRSYEWVQTPYDGWGQRLTQKILWRCWKMATLYKPRREALRRNQSYQHLDLGPQVFRTGGKYNCSLSCKVCARLWWWS